MIMLDIMCNRQAKIVEGGTMNDTKRIRWQSFALAALLLISAFLHFWALEKEGYSNPYYAAAVSGMLKNPAAFFFGSFDSSLFVTVDKPAFGLWLEALSAGVFGVNSFGLLLPSALAGTLSVWLLYRMVKRRWGANAGLIAAGILAFTPILVALSRTNNLDSLLVFFLLLGASFLQTAAEKQSLPRLLLALAMVGIGFNIKMLQAFLVLPAFFLLYWLSKGKFWKKLWHSLVAVLVLAVVSLSWAVAVDLTPEDQRPYVGGSQTNSVIELALGYNGLNRLLGNQNARSNPTVENGAEQTRPEQPRTQAGAARPGGAGQSIPGGPGRNQDAQNPQQGGGRTGGGVGGASENGETGVLRLFDEQLAGLSSWFLLPALGTVAVSAALWLFRRKQLRADEERRRLVDNALFWGAWLLPMAVFFSVAGFMHRYYVVMLAPATAALSAIAFTTAWNNRRRWLLPVLTLSALAVQCVIVARSSWQWLLLAMLPAATAGLIAYFAQKKRIAAILLALSLLISPFAWSLTPVFGTLNSHIPDAGPDADISAGAQQEGGVSTALIDYITANYNGERWALAVSSANVASPIILASDLPVMAIGGFSGADSILTVEELKAYAEAGELRFVLLTQAQAQSEVAQWVRQNATAITIDGRTTLYDLSNIS